MRHTDSDEPKKICLVIQPLTVGVTVLIVTLVTLVGSATRQRTYHNVMSAKAVGSESSELSNLLQTVRIQTTVSLIHLKHFWYFTDSSTKMRITKRMLRTKQVLILMTSGLFLFGTIW